MRRPPDRGTHVARPYRCICVTITVPNRRGTGRTAFHREWASDAAWTPSIVTFVFEIVNRRVGSSTLRHRLRRGRRYVQARRHGDKLAQRNHWTLSPTHAAL